MTVSFTSKGVEKMLLGLSERIRYTPLDVRFELIMAGLTLILISITLLWYLKRMEKRLNENIKEVEAELEQLRNE